MSRRIKIIPHRRIRQKKTNYRQRLDFVRGDKPRLVVRRANKNMSCHIAKFNKTGDFSFAFASSAELSGFGWNVNTGNIPSAYLTGLLCAVRAKAAGIDSAILDIGLFEGHHGGRMFSALKGAIDGGLDIPHSEEAFPSEERLKGGHIASYAAELKKSGKGEYENRFSGYIKAKAEPESLAKLFDSVKAKIISEGAKPKPKKEEHGAKNASPKKKTAPKKSAKG